MKKSKKILISIFIVYLLISALYVFFHIDFLEPPEYAGMGFSPTNNILHLFMGLPKTYTTYGGVSPIFLIEVVVKIILAIVLIRYLKKKK